MANATYSSSRGIEKRKQQRRYRDVEDSGKIQEHMGTIARGDSPMPWSAFGSLLIYNAS